MSPLQRDCLGHQLKQALCTPVAFRSISPPFVLLGIHKFLKISGRRLTSLFTLWPGCPQERKPTRAGVVCAWLTAEPPAL